MTWIAFERATKFIAGIVWASWEVMIREEASPERLVFIAGVLSLSEGIRIVAKHKDEG